MGGTAFAATVRRSPQSVGAIRWALEMSTPLDHNSRSTHPAQGIRAGTGTGETTMEDDPRIKQQQVAEAAAADPLQQAGTHPLGTVTGALGGAVAGAVMGIAAGPVGSLAGAVGGAIAGGALGSGGLDSTPISGPTVGDDRKSSTDGAEPARAGETNRPQ
jgi:phage tail tape-measure protein